MLHYHEFDSRDNGLTKWLRESPRDAPNRHRAREKSNTLFYQFHLVFRIDGVYPPIVL